ncbi:MAG: winged helix-turn-helix domain-containing protein [Methanolobus sp.]
MKKSLLDVIFASDKRKGVLLLLQHGQQEMSYLLKELNTSRQALLPQIKILKEHDLVLQQEDAYELTAMGTLVASRMKPFIDTLETLDKNRDYFTAHDISGIPEPFLKRIREIKDSILIEPEYVNVHDLNTDYQAEGFRSKSIYFVYTFMHPGVPSVLQELMDRKIHVEVINTPELIQKLTTEMPAACEHFFPYENLEMYIYNEDIRISSLTVTDSGFLLRLLGKNGEFSNKQLIVSGEKGRKWGKELYEYYKKDAKLITEI